MVYLLPPSLVPSRMPAPSSPHASMTSAISTTSWACPTPRVPLVYRCNYYGEDIERCWARANSDFTPSRSRRARALEEASLMRIEWSRLRLWKSLYAPYKL
ncbi:hypothetical protein HWV62_4561 [Athelia sp. TMB]|nr:hypothetical protein HWV62_4561 [Athelia sp. TMB]